MSADKMSKYEKISKGTGSAISTPESVRLVCPFEKYEIVVRVSIDGKFLGIDEVRVKQDFRTYSPSVAEKKFVYIDEYHP